MRGVWLAACSACAMLAAGLLVALPATAAKPERVAAGPTAKHALIKHLKREAKQWRRFEAKMVELVAVERDLSGSSQRSRALALTQKLVRESANARTAATKAAKLIRHGARLRRVQAKLKLAKTSVVKIKPGFRKLYAVLGLKAPRKPAADGHSASGSSVRQLLGQANAILIKISITLKFGGCTFSITVTKKTSGQPPYQQATFTVHVTRVCK